MSEGQDEPLFPYSTTIAICIGMLANSMVFTAPLPFVAFMIVDFRMSENLDDAGYTAGWITGMFMVGRLFAGIPWGLAADRWGRKICLVISMFNITLLSIVFGFSTNFFMAIIVRFLLGMGNGFSGIAKSYISEIAKSRDHEVRAFGYINATWGLGNILGPVIGGSLARPTIQYSSVFSKDSIWGHYPYLLPCLVCAFFAGMAAFSILLFVPETLKPSSHNTSYLAVTQNENLDDDLEGACNQVELTSISNKDEKEIENHQIEKEFEDLANPIQEVKELEKSTKDLPTTFAQMLSNSHIQNVFIIYMSFCFISLFFDESFPLYAVTSLSNGGLAWGSLEIGETLASVGFGCIIFQFVCFEGCMKRYFNKGNNDTLVRSLTLVSCIMPFLPLLGDGMLRMVLASDPHANPKTSILLRVVITLVLLSYRLPSLIAYTSSSMIVNASVDTSMRGTVNGLIMTAGKKFISG